MHSNASMIAGDPKWDRSVPVHPEVVAPTIMTSEETAEPGGLEEQREFTRAAADAFSDKAQYEVEKLSSLSHVLLREFSEAEQLRRDTEERWMRDLRQFRGRYEPDIEDKLKGRSKSFVRRTRVKVVTTNSRMMDYLFPAGQEKNWTCEETPKPSLGDEARAALVQQLQQGLGREPTQRELEDQIVAAAKVAAKGMSKTMEDQLVEVRYKKVVRQAVHSGNLYGTGILKGPLVERRVRQRFQQQGGRWTPKSEEYVVPFVDFVPLWRFFPDMVATELDKCRFVYELHLMTRHEMSALAQRKTFHRECILRYLEAHPDGASTQRVYDQELRNMGERDGVQSSAVGMYEVLERWGWLTGEQLQSAGVEVPQERRQESFFTNIWLLPNGEIIKAVIQPINGVTWPYHIYYFDKDETSIFGEGLASIMRDDQEMLNAAIRMMLDNGALTSGPMLEILLSELATTERVDEVLPWKIWYRKSGSDMSRPAIRQIQLDNNLEWLGQMVKLFEQNTDEVTAIPRYMTGENVRTGAAGTASGMSMLMGAANIVVKELLNSWDEGVTRTFIQALYRWNMQFNEDSLIKGDFDVKARGTASLIAKEVLGQQLNAFAEQTNNPADAPFVKRHKLLQRRAETMDMSDIVKTEDEVKLEMESDEGKRMADMQRKLQEATLAQEIAKAQKLAAEAEVAKTKVDEMLANIELRIAETVSRKVETIFAALQAGAAATRDPVTAPAGDEILQSAGYQDKTPQPTIAELNRPPVQDSVGVTSRMGRGYGESFEVEPRGTGQPEPVGTVQPQPPQQPGPGPSPGAVEMPDANTGQRAGIETTRIEP